MRIRLAYDRAGLEVTIPDANLCQVLRSRPAPPLEDVAAAVKAGLLHPLGTPPLAQMAAGKRTACVLVSDITRPVPNREILPPLLAELEGAGVKRENILLLIATGMHHASTPGELVEMLGEQTCARYRIESHVGRDSSSHRYLGETRGGIPVWIDARYLDADLRIATGLVEPHLMAGYSGGRKAICPGICGVETLRPWHGPELLESQRAAPGVLEGNPVHDEAVAIARMAGCDFAVNVVLNSERKAAALFAGAIEEVFLAAVQAFDHIGAIPVEAPAPIVVTSSAGYPLDITWYQAVKGLAGALPAVEPGGTIIMAAGLREGMGADEFAQLTWRMRSFDQFMEELRRPDFFVIDQWQLEEMAKVARRARIKVFSEGLSPADLRRALVEPVRSVEEGIQEALEMYGRRAGIIVIPEGPYVLPRPRPAPGAQRGARRV